MSSKKKLKTDNNVQYLRPELNDDIHTLTIQKLWNRELVQEGKCSLHITECGVDMIQNPFPVCLIRNLVPEDLLKRVVEQIPSLKFHEKSNDLYQFHQTTDVLNFCSNNNSISELYNFIAKDVHSWVQKVLVPSGLKQKISTTFSCYAHGDRLLCHDDKCEDRHIAFVLYLTEGWTTSDGGSLDLFETDDRGDPLRTVVSIPPEYNTLALFEVTPTSYHQVSEVLSSSKKRISLNGWFHKADLDEWPETALRVLETFPPSNDPDLIISEFIFDKYLKFRNQLDIKRIFVSNSEIQLEDFFLHQLLTDMESEFESPDIVWKMTGPANIRHYEIAEPSSLPTALSSVYSMLQSKMWLAFLRNITGLDLSPHTNSDFQKWEKGVLPLCSVEVQRWKPGTYTLVHDRDVEFHLTALDVFIRFPMVDSIPEEDDGPEAGHIIYIDKQSQDEECLLHLGYKKNSLGLIFREPETLRFTKYLDSSAISFYQIQCLYIPWSPPDDEPDLRHVDDSEDDYNSMDGEEEFEEHEVDLCNAELLEDIKEEDDDDDAEQLQPDSNPSKESSNGNL